MRHILPFVLFAPTAALADSGPHLHPHGVDSLWLIAVALIAGAGGLMIGRRWK